MKQEIVQPSPKNASVARWLVKLVLFFNVALVMAALCEVAAYGAQALGMVMVVALLVDVPIALYAFTQDLTFVWSCQHTFDKVCRGLGGNFQYEGFSLGNSIREGLKAKPGQYVGNQTKTVYPTLCTVTGTREAWNGLVKPNPGQDIENFSQNADAFALAYHVPFVNFEEAGNGLIHIRAGKVAVPEEYEFQLNQQFASSKPPHRSEIEVSLVDAQPLQAVKRQQVTRRELQADKESSNVQSQYVRASNVTYEQALARLKRVPMARDMQGRIWTMPIEETHILVAARTNGGKGSWVWSLVLQLAPARKHGLIQFWGCDPKRLELSIGMDWWEHYADTDEGMVELLEQAVQEMFERGSQLQGKARKFTPSPQTPLNVIVIDELGYLSSLLTDRKLQTRADYAIKTLLTQGRSNGYAILGAVQDPRKSTVEYRDLFPIRIAGGLNEARMVDLVLGEGMHDIGAVCERIPLGREGAGVAFVLDVERANKPLLVRAAWCSDVAIRNALVPQVRTLAEAYEVKDEDLSQQFQVPPNMQQP